MIQPARQIHKLKRGVTWRHRYIVTENGAPMDLSGCTARLTARRLGETADPAIVEINASISPVSGMIDFQATPASDADWSLAEFDALLFWVGGRIDQLAFGQMRLSRAITT